MEFFPDIQTLVNIGPLSIKWYAVLIVSGAYLTYMLCVRTFKKAGYSVDMADDIFMGCLIFGVIGARLWFVIFYDLTYYLANPLEIMMTWQGGLAIQGGLFSGALFGYWYARKHHLNFFVFADMIVPHILLAQTIGRWGNFLNQEAFGKVVSESFYRYYPEWIKNHMFIAGEYREPTFLYESVGNIIGWILITFVYKKFGKPKRGDLLYAYLMWYGVVRFFVEGLRTDSLMFMGLRTAQLVSLAFILIGVLGMIGVFRKFSISKPVVLFDFDGTLMDTQEAILETYRELFRRYRPEYTLTHEEELSFLGPALKDVFPKYFEKNVDELIEEYREINFSLHKKVVFPIEGAKEVLDYLKDNGYQIGIVSSKLRDAVIYGLDLFDMTHYFDVILGLDNVEKHKPNLEGIYKACKELNVSRSDVIYVGDSVSDVKAGINANAYTIGFVFNLDRKEALIESKPNIVIENLTEILPILKENHAWTNNMM